MTTRFTITADVELLIVCLATLVSLFFPACDSAANNPNVLFIWVDDLRPEITAFGTDAMVTPVLDSLAKSSVCFRRAYCNVPVCGASRSSVMTGLRPTLQRFTRHDTYAMHDAPDAVALHTHFKRFGYETASIGKVFHHSDDSLQGWTRKPIDFPRRTYTKPSSTIMVGQPGESERGMFYEQARNDASELPDRRIASAACDYLEEIAQSDTSFFLAVGFVKPHLPFIAPENAWHNYPEDEVHLPSNLLTRPEALSVAFTNWSELRQYAGIPQEGPLSETKARTMISGYRACVTHVDEQIGRLLNKLTETQLASQTIIVLVGDHGWNLGEHGMWSKHVCFEPSMRTPLMISSPVHANIQAGAMSDALVEFIDIYPTVCELAGLPQPDHLHGKSLVDVLIEPERPHRSHAYGRIRQGDTIRSDRYRYTEYRDSVGKLLGKMLYDHQLDPGEDINLAYRPEQSEVVADLAKKLHSEVKASK